MTELILETRDQENRTPIIGQMMLTPALGKNYWSYRVVLTPAQAVVGFPKFGTIGIGFAVESEDWNTNLPYTCDAQQIFDHIAENKGDDAIRDEDCVAAIEMIRAAVYATPEHAARMTEQGRPLDWWQPPIVWSTDDGEDGLTQVPAAHELLDLIADRERRIALYPNDDPYSMVRRRELRAEIDDFEAQLARLGDPR